MYEEEPSRTFQSVSTDYFDHAGKQFLIYTDRLSGWPMVQMFGQEATAVKLITTLRKFFSATGVPEVLRSDGGPQYKAKVLDSFFKDWSVRQYKSSPYYHQGNGHAEASVKSVKYLIMKCCRNGNMDTDAFALGLLELRNSPRADGKSPAQMLFGHPIRSILPVHRRAYEQEWQQSTSETEKKRKHVREYTEHRYNLSAKSLPEFKVGSHVNIQDHRTGRWSSTGVVIEVGKNRQYLIKKNDGRITWRNRRFIRKHHSLISPPYPERCVDDPNHTEILVRKRTNTLPGTCLAPPRHRSLSLPDSNAIKDEPPSSPNPYINPVPQPAGAKNKTNIKLPNALNVQPPVVAAGRRRQAPPRLQVNPRKKTYNQ